jgi:hypothetical protein
LSSVCGINGITDFEKAHREWVKEALSRKVVREANWSEAVAVGSLSFVNKLKGELGFKAAHQPRCGGSTVQRSKVQGNTGFSTRRLTVAMRFVKKVKLMCAILPAKMRR